eukprot:gene6028-4331_t
MMIRFSIDVVHFESVDVHNGLLSSCVVPASAAALGVMDRRGVLSVLCDVFAFRVSFSSLVVIVAK